MYVGKSYQNNKVADFCIVCNRTSIIFELFISTNFNLFIVLRSGSVCAVCDFPLEDLKHLFCCVTSSSHLEPQASKPYVN